MAALQFLYRYRYCVLIWSVFELFCFSAVVYGWASLVVVLKEEGFFYDLCDSTNFTESESIQSNVGCINQDRRLNLVFTVGVFTFSIWGLVAGAILDYFGPRKTRLFSCFLLGLSYVFFGLSNKDRPNLIFPGIITMASSGITMFLTVVQENKNRLTSSSKWSTLLFEQVANIFERWKSSVISLFNGALDSSAIVLLLFKVVYDAGVQLKWVYLFYFIFGILSVLCFTFILPPYTITVARIKSLPNYTTSSEQTRESANVPCDSPLISKEDKVNGTAMIDDDNQVHERQQAPLCQEERSEIIIDDAEVIFDEPPRLTKLLLSPEYILLNTFLAVYALRLWFYVGSLNSYLEFMSKNDAEKVSRYTNWFGLAQFAGFLFAPLVGFVMDWRPKGISYKTDVGFVLGFSLTNFTALVLNIFVLIPVLKVQYASFIIQVVLRAFVYATYGSFIFHKFPIVHYGKLYGIGMTIGAVIGSLQYALFTFVENSLNKDPFWVNVGFLVLCIVPLTLPGFLWFKEKKNTRALLSADISQPNDHVITT